MKIESIAATAHEVNRAFCEGTGDNSQPTWDDAPAWQKDSAIEGVNAIKDGKVTGPGDSHRGWLAHKEAAGWTYGETKDPEAKTHPCMVPFDSLPLDQQAKDHLFFQTVSHLLRLDP